jgi:hypothetical protein
MIEYNSVMLSHPTQFFLVFERGGSACHRAGAGNALRISANPGWRQTGGNPLRVRYISRRNGPCFCRCRRNFRDLGEIRCRLRVVKYAGAAYLCYLGLRMILDAQKQEVPLSKEFPPQSTFPRRSAFWQGVTTEVLNPKTALFFLSFIPQFVNRDSGHVFAQFLVLGSISVALNTSADLMVTAVAGPLGSRVRTSARSASGRGRRLA